MRNVTGIGKNYFFKIFEVEILAPRGLDLLYMGRGGEVLGNSPPSQSEIKSVIRVTLAKRFTKSAETRVKAALDTTIPLSLNNACSEFHGETLAVDKG